MTADAAVFEQAMREALALAVKGRFRTAPNPCVGAVLLRGGDIVARGFHEYFGEPHAEVNALADAAAKGVNPAECTLVVTLEPCAHYGKTPPCAEAVLRAGIRRVVIGAPDPNAEAAGGADMLRRDGVSVITGVLERECTDLIADFHTWRTTELPHTILKLASTLDGRIATRNGHSQWISGEQTRALVHEMRRDMGAILVGGNTFYQDNPRLDCRPASGAPPAAKQPLAVVVTSRLPAPDMAAYLIQNRPQDLIFWTTVAAAASSKAEALRKKGVRILGLPPLLLAENTPPSSVRAELDLRAGLASLRQEHGCHYALCEGGGRLGLSLLENRLAGEVRLHLSPRILADNEATPLFDGMSPLQLDDGISLRIAGTSLCGEDLIISLRPSPSTGDAAEGTEL
ncbi:MAG: bifunctional diaminohydroxyphosphoribosylaminopyrimidine deaminase/5-amino-6-(5-phosphoribosylamino)uracil reductase RibD [Deltaproteobacteria bacterium]|jgi:diaminohydroxyphosphoribosylaminopyrimidine deaminase/5-amino-6-(5-phosphoribosylamino)uracil reductase|nr:bifunctional diaminohydroxyphosphoribosylaminopyrimidine deaminase/5-amino-6-(5-phosphoribosylamino)uracil reductase RibD [Deltaproteobacteria bacterium]